MKRQAALAGVLVLMTVAAVSARYVNLNRASSGTEMTAAAQKYLATLSAEQREKSLLEYDTPRRTDWHFIPKDERKGLQVKEMTDDQRAAALALMQSALSEVGYDKATKIMELEGFLLALEKGRGPVRDPRRYYVTLFGEPTDDGRWGLSVEGHHLSLNFVVEKGSVVASTPTVFCANPATVKNEVIESVPVGTRVLASEEQLAFDLLAALNDDQRKEAIIAAEAPREVRAAGEPQPPQSEPEGIAAAKLNRAQTEKLGSLIAAYARNLPEDVSVGLLDEIREAGIDKVHFAWAGAEKPGVGHYYRVQGPTFLIEFVNTQPDAAGNPANHIHCVWRDPRGDFAIPIKAN